MKDYRFLPFRFERRDGEVLLVNDYGEYLFLPARVFEEFTNKSIDQSSQEFLDLKARNMLWSDHLPEVIDLLATKYRTRRRFLFNFTTLHMFVVTQTCNQKCQYCHAQSVHEKSGPTFDMDSGTALKSVEMAFKSPSENIKIEFQGGEPLLNFRMIQEIVEYSEELNKSANKRVEYVICTNLLDLDDNMLDYIKSKDIYLSTSLDGPAYIHDACRKTIDGNGTHKAVTEKIGEVIRYLDRDRISALMTITPFSIDRLREVVDEYQRLNLTSIFLRAMNPMGRANKEWASLGYSQESFLAAYANTLEYIISINRKGSYFPEEFATILLTRILTPFSTGFVDLQSPAGTGIGGVIYDYNGDVYVSDEARMLARTTGDKKFCMGNVHSHTWHDMFQGELLKGIIQSSCIEALPGCSWCVFQPYCGGDPVKNYFLDGDVISSRSSNAVCHKHKGLFELLFKYLHEQDSSVLDVFWSWITRRQFNEVSLSCPPTGEVS